MLGRLKEIVLVGMLVATPCVGQTAGMLSFQGLIKDDLGDPVKGPVDLEFRIYDAEVDGNLVDMDGDGVIEDIIGEDAKEVLAVAVTDGILSTKFGPVSPAAFDGNPRWLEVRVDTDPLSRIEMVTAPAASEQVNIPGSGIPAIEVDDSGDVTIPGTIQVGSSITIDGAANTITSSDNLEVYVSSGRVLRLEANGTGPNVIGGHPDNSVTAGVNLATISGGGQFGLNNRVTDDGGTVGGGRNNQAGDNDGTTTNERFSTVGGGVSNSALADNSTVAGGASNIASGKWSAIGGGANNQATDIYSTVAGGQVNIASGEYATVGGGDGNTASGDQSTVGGGMGNEATGPYNTISGGLSNTAGGSSYATVGGGRSNLASGTDSVVPGGQLNTASGNFSFAAGRRAKSNHDGAFVWGDSTDADFASTANDQFLIRATGGVGIGTDAPEHMLHVVSAEQRAIFGENTSSSGAYGVYGQSNSTSGSPVGVYGEATATTGTSFGGRFVSNGNGWGVFGSNTAATGDTRGVEGRSHSVSGTGVFGWALGVPGGVTYGVRGRNDVLGGYAVFAEGDYGGTGAKYFIHPHPTDPAKQIHFISLEGNESGTYFRGSERLENSRAVIEVPEEFRLVTESEGLTVQVTPLGPNAGLWVESKDLDRIVVRGNGNVEFDYFVNGIRRGYTDLELIRENHAYVPELSGVPYGSQYTEGHRRILVENGILSPDFTPNEQTAARMGWTLRAPGPDDLPGIETHPSTRIAEGSPK